MLIDLSGKTAIVTGAGRGIGLEIASALAAEGVKTVVLDINKEDLDHVSEQFSQKGYDFQTYLCDVREYDRIQQVVSDVVAAYGSIDILVNNAGISKGGLVENLKEEIWDANMDINVKGTFLMCKAVVPVMKKQRSGRIINAASFTAIVPAVYGAAYGASKGAVYQFTRVLAGELGPWNITVNCYAPGMIPTAMNGFAELPKERQEKLLNTLTLRRWGKAEDVANLICFLSSDLASYITGTMIDISGGKLATQSPRNAYEIAAQQNEYTFE